jgi:uncharacterized protein (TIGR02001 family)
VRPAELRNWVLAATVLAAPAGAGTSITVTGASEYQLTGVSISAERPVLQASLDWWSDAGWYAGTWASSGIDFGGCCREDWEFDLYGGWTHTLDAAWTLDLGLSDYEYPGARGLGYTEFGVELRHRSGSSLRLNWSEDFLNTGVDGFYLEGRLERGWGAGPSLYAHLGRTGGPAFSVARGLFPPYTDHALGLTQTWSGWKFDLAWLGTTLDGPQRIERGVLANQGRLWLAVSRAFALSE